MSDFKQTEIGLVPENWKIMELGVVCTQRKEAVTPNFNGKGKYVGLEHIQTGMFRLHNYGNESEVKSAKYKFYDGDILYGKLRPYLDKAALVDFSGICSTDIVVLRGTKQMLQSYLIGLVHTNDFIEYSKKTTSGVNHPRTSWNSLKKFKFGLPTLEEQQNIANILSKVQSAIETQEKIIQTTTELKKALMLKLFTEGLKGEPQKETEIGLVPKSWEIKKIRELVLETETRNPEKEPNKCIKYIDVSSVSNDTFSVICHQDFVGKDAPGRARKVVNTNDVIFATIRPTLKRVAKIMPEYDDQYCSTAFCVLRVGKNRLDFEYLYQYLLTDFFIKEIGKLQSGASYPAVRDDDVKRMKIPYPSIEEQEKISSILKQLDCKKAFAIKKSLLLQSLFKSMLHHLMTGQIRVKDLRFS